MSTFNYFAFGSNLLRQRLRILNESAVFVTIGRLADYKLCFGPVDSNSSTWQGAPASIIESAGDEVWGCVWRLNVDDLPNLDGQEGVCVISAESGKYRPIEVLVECAKLGLLRCRSYQLVPVKSELTLPSPQYVDVILRGARQNGLPKEYIEQLRRTETNGFVGRLKRYDDILAALKADGEL